MTIKVAGKRNYAYVRTLRDRVIIGGVVSGSSLASAPAHLTVAAAAFYSHSYGPLYDSLF